MSVTEIAPRGGDFERTPPHDIDAERCVLGGMLLSRDAISDVLEVIRPHDHYRPAHQIVHEVILDLYGRGEPADAVTVAAELTRRGEVTRVGGADYLHTLIASVPTAANAGYYARIVRERAILRRLVEVGTRIVQLGFSADGDADDLVDQAQAEVYAVTDRRVSEDYLPLSEIMPATLDEIEAIGSHGGRMTGVPTGFADLDALTNGLHPGQMVVIAARPALGKALALDTPLPTPDGWTTIGEVQVGDNLIGADGQPTRVVAATEIMHERPCFEVEFDDGTVIVADAGHQWRTTTRASRRQQAENRTAWYWPDASRARLRDACAAALREPDRQVTGAEVLATLAPEFRSTMHTVGRQVGLDPVRVLVKAGGQQRPYAWHAPAYSSRHALLTARAQQAGRPENAATTAAHQDVKSTAQIAASLRSSADGSLSHAVAVTQAAQFPARELPFPPYALGAWLGHGAARNCHLASADPQIIREIEAEGLRVLKSPAARLRYSIRLPEPHGHRSTAAVLRKLGVLGNEHIPVEYLRAAEAQRRALLAGLLDTDGYVARNGTVQFAVTSRRLAADTMELVLSLGYRARMTTKRVKGAPGQSSTCYTVTFTPSDQVFRLPRKLARQTATAHPATRRRFITDVRPVPSVPVRCVQVDNAEHMYLAGRSWIPTHNSTLALDLARAASVQSRMATVMFSLEMSRNEITMRLLSAEARVPLQTMRTGQLTDDDWTRLARRMSEVADAPLFIDDSPNMSLMEIRSKCRRLKQRNDLRMVIIDYLQLMSSPKKVENRQQEVSEMSRSLKLLAKELDVPVVAVSQLNRGPEQRTDKRPLLSDLRESGCLTADTALLRADTGAPVTFAELLQGDHRDVLVWSLDQHQRLVPSPLTDVFRSGVKDVYRLRLASGREVKASGNHPLLAFDGWTPLEELTVGDRVGIARRVPEPIGAGLGWSEYRLGRLADLPSDQKRIPAVLHSADNREIAVFLRHLWATDGNVTVPRGKAAPKVYYASSSRELAGGVALLLARFGIVARIRQVAKPGYRPGFHAIVADGPSLQTFCREIGVHGARGQLADKLAAFLPGQPVNTITDTLPARVWDLVKAERIRAGLSERQFQAVIGTRYCGSALYRTCPSRERLMRCANALDSAVLRQVASSDIYWDRIVAIEALGPQPVYDATVKVTHNFVANGINLHNSIEQDSDMVILLHREDAYERESPRAGEADLVVAKHRNGPTATVTVAFQGHYSRFVDMAPG